MENNKLISLNKLHKSRRVYWIDSFPTLRKWVIRDLEVNNYLRTKVVDNQGTGKRYYIPIRNIDAFVNAFHNGKLYAKR